MGYAASLCVSEEEEQSVIIANPKPEVNYDEWIRELESRKSDDFIPCDTEYDFDKNEIIWKE